MLRLTVLLWRVAFALVRSMALLRTNTGKDFQSKVMGGDVFTNSTPAGNATATSATSLTNSGAAWTVDMWRGHIVFAGPNNAGTGSRAYGIVLSNTATVLTIDKWYDPTNPGGAAATTPNATANYIIAPGGGPAWWIALTEDTGQTLDATATALTGELVVGTSAGLERALCTYAHTTGASTYTLTKTFTLTGATARTIQRIGVFNSSRDATGQHMVFFSAVPNPPTLVTNDQLTITETVTI